MRADRKEPRQDSPDRTSSLESQEEEGLSSQDTKSAPSMNEIDWNSSDPEYWESLADPYTDELAQGLMEDCPALTRSRAIQRALELTW